MNTRLLKHRLLFLFLTLMLINALTVTISQEASANTDGGCQPLVTVTSTDDSGPGTLRQAIADVCAEGVIDFDLALPNTITLTSGELIIDKPMTIAGPGAELLSVSVTIGRVLQNQGEGVYLSDLTIRDGITAAGGSGMGVLNFGVMTISDSVIRDNTIDNLLGGPALGAGVANYGTLTINNSTITENKVVGNATELGGGLYNMYGTITVNNSTISHNDAIGGGGGGIFNYSGTVFVNHSTVVNNEANYTDGIGTELISLVILHNSIIANNGTNNCDGPGQFISLGHNLSNNEDCNLTGPGDLPNTDPLLGPLQNNGGTTPTHALLPGSPAIDAAASLNCLPTDQRGVPRPQGPRCDIGAFEAVYETMALAHQYWMNDGSSGSGVFSLLTDGSFTDDVGGTGAWSFLPTPPRLLLQYDAGFACDALLAGKFLTDNQVQGVRLCQDDSGVRGVWQATVPD